MPESKQVVVFSTDGRYHGTTTADKVGELEMVRKSAPGYIRTCSQEEWDEVKLAPDRGTLCKELGEAYKPAN